MGMRKYEKFKVMNDSHVIVEAPALENLVFQEWQRLFDRIFRPFVLRYSSILSLIFAAYPEIVDDF